MFEREVGSRKLEEGRQNILNVFSPERAKDNSTGQRPVKSRMTKKGASTKVI